MNSVLGSGGRMKVPVSSSAAAGSELLELAEVDPRLGDGQAADQVLEIVRLQVGQRAPDLVDERHADRVLGCRDLDQPATPLVARGQRLEQVAEQEDLDAALASSRRTGRARGARSTHRTSSNSNSSWFEGVSRWRLSSGRWTMTLLLPTSEWAPKSAIIPPFRRRSRGHHLGPRGAVHDLLDLSQTPDRRTLTRGLDEPHRGLDLRTHRPGGEGGRAQLLGVTRSRRRCSGVPQSAYTPSTSVAMTNSSASTSRARLAREVLVDHGLDADEGPFGSRLVHRGDPAAPGADHDDVLVQEPPGSAGSRRCAWVRAKAPLAATGRRPA